MGTEALLTTYKTIKSFGNDYSLIDHPERYRNELDCLNAYSPTLADLQVAYGSNAKVWIKKQIDMLQTISGVRDKLLAHQIVLLTETFMSNPNAKASMLLNFFHRLISGKYGRFYGSIDIMQIGEAWQSYIKQCNDLYLDQKRRFDAEERAKRDAEKERLHQESLRNAISYDEWRLRMGKEKELPSLSDLAKTIIKPI